MWRVNIIVRHHHDTIVIPTDIYATDIELTKNRKLGNGELMTRCRSLMRRYQRRLKQLRLETYDLDTKTIAAILRGDKNVDIDFLWFFRIWLSSYDRRTQETYRCAYNRFKEYVGSDLFPVSGLSVNLLRSFERSLGGMRRGREYATIVRHAFNDMRQVYNDSDDGNPVIKRTLEGFTHVFGQPVPIVHTPLTVEQVLAVSSVPDDGKFQSVRDLARDTFIISFM
ncbi:MAG: hypothetical protein IIT33_02885, partial [Prevotella sp.]|nr:hypothetical protein [Prevotella sp.]